MHKCFITTAVTVSYNQPRRRRSINANAIIYNDSQVAFRFLNVKRNSMTQYTQDQPPPLRLTALTQQDPDTCRWDVVCSRCSDPQCDIPAGIDMDNTTVPVCEVVPEGVNITRDSGMTLKTLDLMSGFYRTSYKSREVLECYREEACVGGSNASSYCAAGYAGPCEELYLPNACLTALGCVTFKFSGAILNTFNSLL